MPISSSGHLLLVPWLFDWHDFDNSAIEKAFDVALHLGTLIAVVGYFRHELVVYVRDGVRMLRNRGRPGTPEGRLAWLLLLSSIPAAIVGALFEKTIDNRLGKPGLIAVSMILFGVLLGVADRRSGYPLELLVRAAAAGWRVVELDVGYGPRAGGKSKVSGSVRGSAIAALDFWKALS